MHVVYKKYLVIYGLDQSVTTSFSSPDAHPDVSPGFSRCLMGINSTIHNNHPLSSPCNKANCKQNAFLLVNPKDHKVYWNQSFQQAFHSVIGVTFTSSGMGAPTNPEMALRTAVPAQISSAYWNRQPPLVWSTKMPEKPLTIPLSQIAVF